MACVKIELLPPSDCLVYAILSNCVGSTSFHLFIKATGSQRRSGIQSVTHGGWLLWILCQIGYRGLPTKEKVSSRESVIRYAIKAF